MQLLNPASCLDEAGVAEILIVEDSPADLRLLRQMLVQAGFSVRIAQTGQIALQSVQKRRPDLVLLDIKLPDVDGYDICAQLQAQADREPIPVIFLSGLVQPTDKVKAFDYGGTDYITKPYHAEELLARIHCHLEHQRTQRMLRQQNQRLQQQEERWQLLLQGTGDGICDLDLGTQEIMLSAQYWSLLGYPPQDRTIAIGEWEALIHPEDRAAVQEHVAAYLSHQHPQLKIEFRLRCQDGSYKWILARGKATWDEDGKPLRIVGVHQDISDRKHAESLIHANLAQEKAIAHITDQIHRSLDSGRIFETTVQTLRRVLACDRVLIYRFNLDWHGQIIAEAVESGWPAALSPTAPPHAAAMQAMVDEVTRYPGWGLQHPISEPYRAAIVSDIHQVDLAPTYRDFLARLQVSAYAIVPIYRNNGLWGVLGAYQHQTPRQWLKTDTAILNAAAFQLGIALSQAQLFAQIQQKSAELEQAKTAAEAANQAKSTFLANMSHELRTPLNAILGYAQVLHGEPELQTSHREQLQTILQSGEHLLSLINGVLDFAKIEVGRMEVYPEQFILVDLLRTLQNMFWPQAEAKGLRLELQLAADLPGRIVSDLNKLRQILINLLGNAIKFTPQGKVTLRVWTTQAGPDQALAAAGWCGAYLHVAVTDTGIGIPLHEQQKIFNAFEQATSTQSMPNGTGLGLSISKRLVELLDGRLTLHSVPEQGSTFEFAIPVRVAYSDAARTEQTARAVGLVPNHLLYRVLVVDDAYLDRRIVTRLLQSTGFEVAEAEDGEAALRAWQTLKPHLVLIDMRMPKLSGYDVVRIIREHEQSAVDQAAAEPTRMVAVTAAALASEQQAAIAVGCDAILTKPIQVDRFFTQIGRLLNIDCQYEATSSAARTPPPVIEPLRAEDFAPVSDVWLRQVHYAALLCNDSKVSQLLEQLPAGCRLQRVLAHYTQALQLGEILDLIEPYLQDTNACADA